MPTNDAHGWHTEVAVCVTHLPATSCRRQPPLRAKACTSEGEASRGHQKYRQKYRPGSEVPKLHPQYPFKYSVNGRNASRRCVCVAPGVAPAHASTHRRPLTGHRALVGRAGCGVGLCKSPASGVRERGAVRPRRQLHCDPDHWACARGCCHPVPGAKRWPSGRTSP